jgi:hypothetical protein
MSWIESHSQVKDHPKTGDLRAAMGWSLGTTIGNLHLFWWWCMAYAEDGDLSKHNPERIAIAMDLPPEQGKKVLAALSASGWVDKKPYLRVHDWWQYAGPFLRSKYKRTENVWMAIKCLYVTVAREVPATLEPTNQPTNQPTNHTNQPKVKLEPIADFDAFWKAYPIRVGKETARKAWTKARPDADLLGVILAAIAAQSKSEQWTKAGGEFIPHPTTWLNQKRWEDELTGNPGRNTSAPRKPEGPWKCDNCGRLDQRGNAWDGKICVPCEGETFSGTLPPMKIKTAGPPS